MVHVHSRNALAECERAYRGRRVRSNAGQCPQCVECCRKRAAMLPEKSPRRPMQAHGTVIVPQSRPRPHDRSPPRAAQMQHCREPLQERSVLRQHAVNLRLLEHDFGHENFVRIARSSPGQITAVRSKPPPQRTLNLERCGRGHRLTHCAVISHFFRTRRRSPHGNDCGNPSNF